jgi:hypothetical protein
LGAHIHGLTENKGTELIVSALKKTNNRTHSISPEENQIILTYLGAHIHGLTENKGTELIVSALKKTNNITHSISSEENKQQNS